MNRERKKRPSAASASRHEQTWCFGLAGAVREVMGERERGREREREVRERERETAHPVDELSLHKSKRNLCNFEMQL